MDILKTVKAKISPRRKPHPYAKEVVLEESLLLDFQGVHPRILPNDLIFV